MKTLLFSLTCFLLTASSARAQAIETLSVAGVVIDNQGMKRVAGIKVGLYSTDSKGTPLTEDTTSDTGVYNLVFHDLTKTVKLYVRYEGERFSRAVVPVFLPGAYGEICHARPKDLVLRPPKPQPGDSAGHLAAFTNVISADLDLGLLDKAKANRIVAAEVWEVAGFLGPSGSPESLYEETRKQMEIADSRLDVLRRDVFLSAAKGVWQPEVRLAFSDPAGDDFGPGTYTYPTDAVYKRGAFDLKSFDVIAANGKVSLDVSVGSFLEDHWGMGAGFSTQLVFVFIDTDGKEGSGFTSGVPGLNIQFAPSDAWDRLVILSPQPPGRVQSEIQQKLPAAMQAVVVIPRRVKGGGRTISATVDHEALGGGDPASWGYQVIVQSNEGFPEEKDLLTRRVNEFEGQHRFGGGTDSDCDPNVLDILAGKGTGDASEVEEQRRMLSYECAPDGTPKDMATLRMVRLQ